MVQITLTSNNYVELVCGASPPLGTALEMTVQKLSSYDISSNGHSADYILYGLLAVHQLQFPSLIKLQLQLQSESNFNPYGATPTPYNPTSAPIYNFPIPASTSIISIKVTVLVNLGPHNPSSNCCDPTLRCLHRSQPNTKKKAQVKNIFSFFY